MNIRPPRLEVIELLTVQGVITRWSQILDYEKPGFIANYTRFDRRKVKVLLEKPMECPLKDLIELGSVFGFNEWQTFELVMGEEREA